MLDLLAIEYWNIGPFRDQKKLLVFHQGKYLIKAPIGSGKSFLFFDGPSYALYKSAYRNLLNIQSKLGSIKLLFSYNDQVFLIKRLLKKGKSKDGCNSELFMVQATPQELAELWQDRNVFQSGDLEVELERHHIVLERSLFKNESDLQQHLQEILPPQGVFSSTILLLQDAENIFELQPAERLEVLKNVFNLMGIDETKEVVKERRTELKYRINALEDTSLYQEKLKTGLQRLIGAWREIFRSEQMMSYAEPAREVVEELETYIDKLGIVQFELDEKLLMIIDPMVSLLNQEAQYLQSKKEQLNALSSQKGALENQMRTLFSQIQERKRRIDLIDSRLLLINPDRIQQLRTEKLQLQETQTKLKADPSVQTVRNFWISYQERWNLESRSDFDLLQSWLCIQDLISLGKLLKQENQNLLDQQENLKVKMKNELESLTYQIKTLQERESFYQGQRESLSQKIEAFDQATEENARYHCASIAGQCPFIKAINKQHFEQREQEKNKLLLEQKALLTKIEQEDLGGKLRQAQLMIEELQRGEEHQSKLDLLVQQGRENEQRIQVLRTFFGGLDLKNLESLVNEYKQLTIKISGLEVQLLQEEQLLGQLQALQQEKAQLSGENTSSLDQFNLFEQQKQRLEEQMRGLDAELAHYPQRARDYLTTMVIDYKESYQSLSKMIVEYKDIQVKVKALKEEAKLLDNLYKVLNKELLLFALSEYLPILSDIINSYLVNVVDYQISIKLMETAEKLELETKILDDKGERDIKSLSGGQRAVLKLVWMLAISSYMKTKLLFLDETINNLDQETVAKVADLLTDFVKQRAMKFYAITHNSEIQAMGIWDQTISVA